MMRRTSIAFALALLAITAACKKKNDTAASGSGSATPAAAPATAATGKLPWEPDSMTHDSPACRKALACCEAKVAVENPMAKAEDYNGACSGPALAASDADCDQFRKGYVDEVTAAKKSVPGACN